MKRPFAYITAPWGANEFENTETAAKYCRDVYDAGFAPICPILWLSLFLADDIPQEHKDGIDIARDLLRRAHVLVVCGKTVDEQVKNDITVADLETTDRRDFYDIAVGNVPFGQYQVNDRAYNKLGFSIHDYFFAKTLDQVRLGGVIAFVTSKYTMDKQSPEVRRYIARRAELLGAIRLPNNAFKANAGTEVVSDILLLQKRDRPIEIEPDWVHLGRNEDGFAINSYFIDHPEMVLGTPTSESTQYGRQDYTGCSHSRR